jgi:hypothetical protein
MSHSHPHPHPHLVRDLSNKLQDTLDFIEESIDETLAKLCSHFNLHTYQRLLSAYRLLGKSSAFMDQLQMHFVNAVQTKTMDIILKNVGTTKNDPTLSSYADLCKVTSPIITVGDTSHRRAPRSIQAVPEDSFSSCLHELNVCFWQIIKSYKLIWLWHEKSPTDVDGETASLDSRRHCAARSHLAANGSDTPEPSQDFLLQRLDSGSTRVWHEIQQKMKTFLVESILTHFKFDAFLQILKMINR